MPNVVKLSPVVLPALESPDDILNAGDFGAGAIMRLQTSATQAGTFADVSGAGSTPTTTIITGTRSYAAFDPAGIVSSWYRVRLENIGATRLGDWSDTFQVAGEGAGLICALDDVKQRLGIPASTTTNDENILDFINQVGTEIMGYTGRRFVRSPLSGETTYLFDVRVGGRTLWVPAGIASVSVVEVAFQTGGTFTTVPTADWFLDPPVQERTFGWPGTRISISPNPSGSVPFFYPGKRVARLTMALGWTSVPQDVSGIAQRAVASAYLSKGAPGGVNAVAGPSGALVILRGISPADVATLDRYRVRPV